MKDDLISRQDAIDAVKTYWYIEVATIPKDMDFAKVADKCTAIFEYSADIRKVLEGLPSAQPDDWLTKNKDKILKAGLEGREEDFYIGGRLFAIREKAQ